MSLSTGAVRARVSRLRPDSRARSRLSVVPPRVTTARSGPFVMLVAAILVLGLIGLLLLNLSMQKASFQLAALQDRADALQTREQRLDVMVDRLSSSDRLTDEAARMGMVPNPNPVFLDLSNGKVIGDPAVAQPRVVPAAPSTGDAGSTAQDDATPTHGDTTSGRGDSAGHGDSTGHGDTSGHNDSASHGDSTESSGAATHDGGAATDGGNSTTSHGDSTDHTGTNNATHDGGGTDSHSGADSHSGHSGTDSTADGRGR